MITNNATASAFSADIAAAAILAIRGTLFEPGALWETGNTISTGPVTDLAVQTIQDLGDVGADSRIMDISTDGVPTTPENETVATAAALAAATAANAAGITVSAIGVGGVDTAFLDDFTTNGGGFFVTAIDFGAFQLVLEDKLETELDTTPPPPTSVPEPAIRRAFFIPALDFLSKAKSYKKSGEVKRDTYRIITKPLNMIRSDFKSPKPSLRFLTHRTNTNEGSCQVNPSIEHGIALNSGKSVAGIPIFHSYCYCQRQPQK